MHVWPPTSRPCTHQRDATGGFSRAWSGEPRYGGSYAVYRPGQVTAHWQVLRRPYGPIWLRASTPQRGPATWRAPSRAASELQSEIVRELASRCNASK